MKKVSFVIPCYRSEKTLPSVINEIVETVTGKLDYEIVLVNDCSPDNTFDVIKQLCQNNPNITGINFSQNFGQHAALMAGMRQTSGEVVVCLDDDGQTPANEVFKLLDKLDEGYDTVYARYGNKKHSMLRNLGSKVNSVMTEQMLSKPKKLFISSYFAVKRFIVDKMLEYNNPFPYVIGLVLRATKNITNVDVNHRSREAGQSGYTFKKLISLWVNGFTAFSVKPLRIATFGGVMVAIAGFAFLIYTIVNKIINPDVLLGWSSIMAVMLMLGGLILLVLGMIGEYIGRIYICMNHSPQYVIKEIVKNEENTL